MSVFKKLVFVTLITATLVPTHSFAILDVPTEDQSPAKGSFRGLSIKDIAMITIGGAGVMLAAFFGHSYLKNRKKSIAEKLTTTIKEGLQNTPAVLEALNKTAADPETKKNIDKIATELHQVVDTCKTKFGPSLQQLRDDSSEILNALQLRTTNFPVHANEIPGLVNLGVQLGSQALSDEAKTHLATTLASFLDGNDDDEENVQQPRILNPQVRAMLKNMIPMPQPSTNNNARNAQQPSFDQLFLQALGNPAVRRVLPKVMSLINQQNAQPQTPSLSSADLMGLLNQLGLTNIGLDQPQNPGNRPNR